MGIPKPTPRTRGWFGYCGHCTKKSEPTSSRTPDFARSACVVALTKKVRSDLPEPRHARGTPRPSLLLSILIFCGGGFEKRNGRQKRGAALPFQDSKKRKLAGFKYNKEQTARMH